MTQFCFRFYDNVANICMLYECDIIYFASFDQQGKVVALITRPYLPITMFSHGNVDIVT